MQKNIIERIKVEYEDLTRSERRVANCIIDNPQLVISENIAELANRAKVSQPTVFRFCKRFGSKGFPDFKFLLSAIAFENTSNKFDLTVNNNSVLTNTLQKNLKTINKLSEYIQSGLFIEFARKLYNTNRVVLFTNKISCIEALILQSTLFNQNKLCDIYNTKEKCELCIEYLSNKDTAVFFFFDNYQDELCLYKSLSQRGIDVLYVGNTRINKEIEYFNSLEIDLKNMGANFNNIKIEISCVFSQLLDHAFNLIKEENGLNKEKKCEQRNDAFITYDI